MDLQTLAQKLRKAREARGLSQQAAGDVMGLARTAVTQIEGGNRSVSTLELTEFSKLYQQPIAYFLDEVTHGEEEPEVLLYRAMPGLERTPEVKQQIEHYIALCKVGMVLEKILGRQSWVKPPKYHAPLPSHKSEAVVQAESIAEQERKRLGLGLEPINDLPNLIAQQRVWVVGANFPDKISGLFLNATATGMVILVNNNHAKARKRFSYAHEYCHVLLDSDDKVMSISSAENHAELVEVRANAFAAAFLMPAEGVAEFLRKMNKGQPSRQEQMIFDVATQGQSNSENRNPPYSQNITYQDVAMMAHRFGVSYQVATYRLRSLNFISAIECDKLIAKYADGKKLLDALKMSSDLEGEQDSKLQNRELCREIACYAIEAYRRHEISRGRVFELGEQLGIGGKELYDLAVASLENTNAGK